MQTTPLGHTGVDVSALCLGTMLFGTTTDSETSWRLLDAYIEAGGSFLDTSNTYARWAPGGQGGESELLLGAWMRERRNRAALFIATKVGFPVPRSGLEAGLRTDQIERACEESLQRMGIETIDLYYTHRDDRSTPLEETLEALDRLVQAGKVRFVGASNLRTWRLATAHTLSQERGWAGYCCIQQRYSYLRPKPWATFGNQVAADVDLLDFCQSTGVTLLAYSPLLKGAYGRADREFGEGYAWDDSAARLAVLREVAEEVGVSPNQVVLAWMLQSSPLVLPIIGASSLAQLQENLGATSVRLAPEQMTRLNQAGV